MIRTVWPYLAIMLLAAGIFPALERRYGWLFLSVFPSLLLTCLLVAALAVSAPWEADAGIESAQSLALPPLASVLPLALAARVFHPALFLCGIASRAHIGGVAATPLLAAGYSRTLVPVGNLLALPGCILGAAPAYWWLPFSRPCLPSEGGSCDSSVQP